MAKIRAEATQGCQGELVSLNSALIDSLPGKATVRVWQGHY